MICSMRVVAVLSKDGATAGPARFAGPRVVAYLRGLSTWQPRRCRDLSTDLRVASRFRSAGRRLLLEELADRLERSRADD